MHAPQSTRQSPSVCVHGRATARAVQGWFSTQLDRLSSLRWFPSLREQLQPATRYIYRNHALQLQNSRTHSLRRMNSAPISQAHARSRVPTAGLWTLDISHQLSKLHAVLQLLPWLPVLHFPHGTEPARPVGNLGHSRSPTLPSRHLLGPTAHVPQVLIS